MPTSASPTASRAKMVSSVVLKRRAAVWRPISCSRLTTSPIDCSASAWCTASRIAPTSCNCRPLQLVGAIRDAVHQADAEQSIGDVVSLEQLIGRQTAARRFNTTLLTIFALLAVGLALVGIYGVTAYAVTQRTRELGIRMALGARGVDVVRLLMRESLRRVALGVGLGLVAALGVTRALSAMLFEVAPRDAVTFAATALLLVAVALAATWLPARRATKVDPMVALRYE